MLRGLLLSFIFCGQVALAASNCGDIVRETFDSKVAQALAKKVRAHAFQKGDQRLVLMNSRDFKKNQAGSKLLAELYAETDKKISSHYLSMDYKSPHESRGRQFGLIAKTSGWIAVASNFFYIVGTLAMKFGNGRLPDALMHPVNTHRAELWHINGWWFLSNMIFTSFVPVLKGSSAALRAQEALNFSRDKVTYENSEGETIERKANFRDVPTHILNPAPLIEVSAGQKFALMLERLRRNTVMLAVLPWALPYLFKLNALFSPEVVDPFPQIEALPANLRHSTLASYYGIFLGIPWLEHFLPTKAFRSLRQKAWDAYLTKFEEEVAQMKNDFQFVVVDSDFESGFTTILKRQGWQTIP